MKKIVLIGAGGHCKVIIDIIKSTKEYEIIGIVDNNATGSVFNIPIIGNDSILCDLYKNGVEYAFIAIGALNNISIRSNIDTKIKKMGFKFPTLIHKGAIISPFSYIGTGTCVMAGVVVNPGVDIAENCIINTGSIIEHDCKIGNNTHISPNVSIAGGVNVGANSHIGIGSSVIEGIKIGNNVTIGAGSVVITDIKEFSLAVGIPAKVIKIKNQLDKEG